MYRDISEVHCILYTKKRESPGDGGAGSIKDLFDFYVTRVCSNGEGHERFWRLSWYHIGMYIEQYTIRQDEIASINNDHWRRFRIQWADFRNANRGKNAPAVFGHQLYRLPEDDRKPEYHEIDIEAMKRRFGSKLKKKNG